MWTTYSGGVKRENTAINLPEEVLTDTGLIVSERVTLMAMYYRIDPSGVVQCDASELAGISGQSLGTINRHIRNFLDQEWITVVDADEPRRRSESRQFQMVLTPAGGRYGAK